MFGIWPRSHPLSFQIFAIKRIWLLTFNSSKNALSNVGREQNWPEGIELGSKISESIPRWQVIWEKKTKASYSKVFNIWNKRHTPSTLLAVRLQIWKAGEELGWFVLPGVSTVAQAVFGECSRWSWWSVCFWVGLRSWFPRDVPSTSVQYSWSAECSQDGVVRTPLPWQHGSQFRRFYRF